MKRHRGRKSGRESEGERGSMGWERPPHATPDPVEFGGAPLCHTRKTSVFYFSLSPRNVDLGMSRMPGAIWMIDVSTRVMRVWQEKLRRIPRWGKREGRDGVYQI